MTITVTHLTSGFDTDNSDIAVTASVSPSSGPVLIGVFTNDVSNPTAVPVPSGLGLTWDQVSSSPGFGNFHLSLWLGLGTPSSGSVTLDFAVPMNNISWSMVALSGVDQTTPVAESNVGDGTGITSLAVPLPLGGIGVGNATVGWFGINAQENITPGAGYTELGEAQADSPSLTIASEWRPDGQATVDASWPTSHGGAGVVVELAAASTASAFMPDVVVEVAFDSTPDVASPTWTDVSAYVEAAAPITTSRGRSDELTDVQPSRLQVAFDNTDGRFTPGNTTSPYYPNVKKNRQIRVTAAPVGGTVRHRFRGYVDEWPVTWPAGTDTNAAAVVTASSRRARLAAGTELRSIIEEEYLLDLPRVYYPLGEAPPTPGRPGQAGDVSGWQQPNLVATGSGFITWQDATGPATDALSAPVFHDNGRYLEMTEGPVGLLGSFTIEAFVNTTSSGTVRTAVAAFASTNRYAWVGVNTSGELEAQSALGLGALDYQLTSATDVNDGETHHVALRHDYGGGNLTADLFLDGVLVDTDTGALDFWAPDRIVVGGFPLAGVFSGGWVGSVSHVAMTLSDNLPDARIERHAEAGLTGFEGDDATFRFNRLAEYAGVTDLIAIDTRDVLSFAAQQTDGKTVIALMQEVADTEGGVLFDAADGTLTLHGRDYRYNPVVSFTLDASLQEIEASVEAKMDGQFLVNDITATRAGGDLAIRVTNEDSISEHGVHRDSIEVYTTDDNDLLDAANWRVQRYGEPDVRIHSVAVDLINSPAALVADLLDAEISDRITLTNLPAQAPAPSYDGFIEGISETIGAESYTITFELSPAAIFDVWKLGTAGRSELDETTILAY